MSKPYMLLNAEQSPNPYPGVTLAWTMTFATNVATCAGHPYIDGDAVKVYNVGGALPAASPVITAGTVYYIRDVVAATSFKLALTPGGTAIDFTDDGTGTQYVGELSSSNVFWIPGIKLERKMNTEFEDRSDEMRGLLEDVASLPIAHNPSWGINMRAYPNLLGLFMLMWAGNVTTTDGDGIITDPDGNVIPAGAYRHVFSFRTGLTPTSLKIQAADDHTSGPYWLLTGAFLQSLKLSMGKGSLMMDAKGKALYMERPASRPAACDTPAFPALTLWPWSSKQLRLTSTLNAGGAWPGLTNIELDSLDMELLQDAVALATGQVPSLFPDTAELDKKYRQVQGSFSTRSLDKDDWDAVKAATTFNMVAYFNSQQIIASGYPYRMWMQMPETQIFDGDEGDIENTPRIPYKMKFKATYDSTATYAGKVTIVNGQSGYKTGITIS